MYKLLSIAALLTYVSATTVQQCKSGLPMPQSVVVKDCETPPCLLAQGSVATMNVQWIASKYLEMIHIGVIANALGIEVEYPLPVHDVCSVISNTACPVVEGELIEFTISMDILDEFPQVPVNLEFFLSDSHHGGETMNCFSFDAQVVAP